MSFPLLNQSFRFGKSQVRRNSTSRVSFGASVILTDRPPRGHSVLFSNVTSRNIPSSVKSSHISVMFAFQPFGLNSLRKEIVFEASVVVVSAIVPHVSLVLSTLSEVM